MMAQIQTVLFVIPAHVKNHRYQVMAALIPHVSMWSRQEILGFLSDKEINAFKLIFSGNTRMSKCKSGHQDKAEERLPRCMPVLYQRQVLEQQEKNLHRQIQAL